MQILVTTPEKSPFSNVAKAVVDEYNRVWNFDYLSANANRQWFTVECISRFYSIECSMEKLRERLQMLEEIIFLQNHIHECIDSVWTANDKDHAAKLLKEKFGLSMAVYLDERISNLTESRRSVIKDEVAELKDYIERLKSKIPAVYQNLQNL